MVPSHFLPSSDRETRFYCTAEMAKSFPQSELENQSKMQVVECGLVARNPVVFYAYWNLGIIHWQVWTLRFAISLDCIVNHFNLTDFFSPPHWNLSVFWCHVNATAMDPSQLHWWLIEKSSSLLLFLWPFQHVFFLVHFLYFPSLSQTSTVPNYGQLHQRYSCYYMHRSFFVSVLETLWTVPAERPNVLCSTSQLKIKQEGWFLSVTFHVIMYLIFSTWYWTLRRMYMEHIIKYLIKSSIPI